MKNQLYKTLVLLAVFVCAIAVMNDGVAKPQKDQARRLDLSFGLYLTQDDGKAMTKKPAELKFVLPLREGAFAEIAQFRSVQKTLGQFKVLISYQTNTFTLRVTDTKTQKQILQNLYQIDPTQADHIQKAKTLIPLSYITHPTTGNILQIYCKEIKGN